MKNVFIINENTGSAILYGVGTYVRETANMMLSIGYNVSIIILNNYNVEFEIRYDNKLTIINIPRLNVPQSIIKYYESVTRLLGIYYEDIDESLFLFNYNSHFAIAELLRTKHNNIKIIYTIHYACWNLDKAHANAYIEESNLLNMIDLADRIICLSDDSQQEINKILNIEHNKLSIIPNSISDKYIEYSLEQRLDIRSNFYIAHDEKVILYVGRLEIMKGVSSLIKAFHLILEEYRNSKLIIVGDGNFAEISQNLGKVTSRISFTGHISQEELIKWYNIADVGVMPSYSEECSFVGIEMMMHGLPIVASNGRGVRNMFHNMQNCLSVDCQMGEKVFEKELSEAILKLLNSETLANNLRKKTRQWYLNNYQSKFMEKKYISLIENTTK